MLTQEALKAILRYDPETGIFTWLVRRRAGRHGWVQPGTPAGSLLPSGYVDIGIDGKHYLAHRLAWLYVTGRWPIGKGDHRNRNRSDNRWANLRPASTAQNNCNKSLSTRNKSGVHGVCFDAQKGKWRATISSLGKQHHLGHFEAIGDAAAAYRHASLRLHGEFSAVGGAP